MGEHRKHEQWNLTAHQSYTMYDIQLAFSTACVCIHYTAFKLIRTTTIQLHCDRLGECHFTLKKKEKGNIYIFNT